MLAHELLISNKNWLALPCLLGRIIPSNGDTNAFGTTLLAMLAAWPKTSKQKEQNQEQAFWLLLEQFLAQHVHNTFHLNNNVRERLLCQIRTIR